MFPLAGFRMRKAQGNIRDSVFGRVPSRLAVASGCKLCLLTQFEALAALKRECQAIAVDPIGLMQRPRTSRVIACDFGVARTISGPTRDLFHAESGQPCCVVTTPMRRNNYSDPISIQTASVRVVYRSRGTLNRIRSWKRDRRNDKLHHSAFLMIGQ